MENQGDRLSYSFGVKMNIGNYQNIDLNVEYASDVRSDETPDKAFVRIKKYVEKKIEQEISLAQEDFKDREF